MFFIQYTVNTTEYDYAGYRYFENRVTSQESHFKSVPFVYLSGSIFS